MNPSLRFTLFILGFSVVLALGSLYMGSRAATWLRWSEKHRKKVWWFTAVFVVLETACFVFHRANPALFSQIIVVYWLTYIIVGLFASMLFYTVLVDVGLPLWKSLRKPSPQRVVDIERRSFLAIGTVSVTSTVVGGVQAVTGPTVYEVDIPLKNLPKEFDGFRIVQITDLHVGPTIGKSYTEKVVAMANSLKPDLVALTGDFVDGTVPQLRDDVSPLKHLSAEHGVFYTTGNHEYMWGAEEWIDEFKRLGARVLLNEHVLIHKNGQQIVLAGVNDFSADKVIPSHASSPSKAIQGAPTDKVKILLAHQPKSYEEAYKAGFDLQLSGHTHGGQFFPFNLLVALIHRYYKGLNKHENMWVYVSRGTGYWGPPLRFGVPTEITLIRLRQG